MAPKTIMGIGSGETMNFLTGESLTQTYYFKSKAKLKCCPIVKACFLFTITPQFPIVSKLFCNGIFDIIKYFDAPSFLVAPLLVVAPRKLLMSLVSLSCFSHKRGSFSCIY